jgi:type II secretory pathway component PulF
MELQSMNVEFKALNQSGVMVTDSLVVDELSEARAELMRRGLTPISIGQGSGGLASGFSLKSFFAQTNAADTATPKKASKKDLPFFTTQMAILLETGTPVSPSLSAIERQLRCPHWKLVVNQLHRHVEEGGSLASAVEMYPKLFDPIYASMISAGEASGNLAAILNRLAELSQQSDRIRNKIKSAMIYPTLLTFISLNVLSVLIFFVLPRFGVVFEEMNVTLPASTKALLLISETVRQHIILSIGTLVISIFSIIMWLRSEPGRHFIDRFSLKIPVAGELIASIITARLFRLIGLLIQANVPLLDTLELTRRSTRHYLFSQMICDTHDNVLVGQPMHEVMTRSKLISPSMTQMVQTGEENGQIGKVMTLLANYLDDRNDTKISTLTSIMEPVILIVMGVLIGGISISLVLPMFDLTKIAGN